MNFLFPQFLWALLALSIPVIIHLFNFRKAKKVYFSNVDMLRHVKQTSSSRLKLRHWLVLLSRLLAIFFLVMAFAQPFLSADNGKETSGNVVIYLDNSQSMSNLTEAETPGIDLSAALAQEIINAYPRETRFQLLTNDFAPFSNYAKSKVDIEELLTELSYSSIVRNPAEIVDRIDASAKATDIYWISDFAYDPEAPLETTDTVNSYKLLPIGFPNTSNIFIDSAYLESPFLTEGQANTLYVSLRNNSEQTKEDMPIKLFVNDIQVAAVTSDLVPNGQTTLSFNLNMALEQFNRCYLSIDDFPVLFDNDFYFTLNRSARVAVVEIRGQNASASITRVFSNSGLFDLETFDVGNIDYSSFEGAELLVLNEVEQLNSGLLALVTGFLSSGRTALLVPAQGVFDSDWVQVFGPLRQHEGTAREELAAPDLTNPFYANVFEATDERMEMPSAVRTLSWGNTGNHLLRFRSGSPYLSSVEVSSGTLYLLASSLNAGESSFANNALFVPVMYKLAIGARSSQSQLYYSLNEAVINTKGGQTTGNELYKLKRADQEIVPGQQTLGAQVRLDIPRFMMGAGFYDITLGDESVDVVAFNLDKEESILKPMDDVQILEAFNPVLKKEILKVFSAEDLEKNLKERFSGKELWKYALILTLIFLLVEVLLLRFL